jgi:MFS family permease
MPTTNTVRPLIALAAVAWTVVGGYGMWQILVEDSGENWQAPYAVFTIALFLGTLFAMAAAWIVNRHGPRSPLETFGFGICVLAVMGTLVAWALPLWMTLSGVGYAVVAAAGRHPGRRAVALLSAAQMLGMAVLFTGIFAELGRQDPYGDHPVAFGLGTILLAVTTVVALVALERAVDRDRVAERSQPSVATT